jgi:hypothetical protein
VEGPLGRQLWAQSGITAPGTVAAWWSTGLGRDLGIYARLLSCLMMSQTASTARVLPEAAACGADPKPVSADRGRQNGTPSGGKPSPAQTVSVTEGEHPRAGVLTFGAEYALLFYRMRSSLG